MNIRIAVEKFENVFLLHLGLEISEHRDDVKEGETEVSLPASISANNHALVHETVLYVFLMERIVPDLGEIHFHTASESPVILDGESL